YDAPEVDNECILTIENSPVTVGSFCMATISDSSAYELYGKIENIE
ncbi:MAG: 30S ribosomal protein S12 methylthiotransferase RimO, partial [Chlorobiaceae bacterium]